MGTTDVQVETPRRATDIPHKGEAEEEGHRGPQLTGPEQPRCGQVRVRVREGKTTPELLPVPLGAGLLEAEPLEDTPQGGTLLAGIHLDDIHREGTPLLSLTSYSHSITTHFCIVVCGCNTWNLYLLCNTIKSLKVH